MKKMEIVEFVKFNKSQIGLKSQKAFKRSLTELETQSENDKEENTILVIKYNTNFFKLQKENAFK